MDRCTVLLVGLVLSGSAQASEPGPSETLALTLRSLALAQMPRPLYDKRFDWGEQKWTANGLTWRPARVLLRPKLQKKPKNHGVWRHVRVEAINPAQTFLLSLHRVHSPQPGTSTFELWVACDIRIHYEQQNWRSGVRLFSGSTRAKCKIVAQLFCESTARLDARDGQLIPDLVFRIRVTRANVRYSGLDFDHVLGLGGDGADRLGRGLMHFLDRFRPNYEQDLLAKANAAIVKAADSKEVRLQLAKLFGN